MSGTVPRPTTLYAPLFPEESDQGDPFILSIPDGVEARFRFYVYTTGENPATGRAFPAYGSDDLIAWRRLGEALEADTGRAHWAPCVRFVPGLELPYVMLYSRAVGAGAQGHVGHRIRRAHSRLPDGPFIDSGEELTPDLDFAIDPDVYRLADGTLKVAFAMDFVDDEPYGTGIVEADIDEALTGLTGAPRLLARPRADWHVFEPSRVMPWKAIPGVDWERQTVRWSTVEAPVGGLVSPAGIPVYLYSGGCFYAFYAVGALIGDDEGRLVDVTDGVANFVIRPQPERGFFAPGHGSWLRLDDGSEYLMLHARFGSPRAKRQMCLVPLGWNDQDLPYTAPLP